MPTLRRTVKRYGLSNATLMGAVAALAVVSVLSMIQNGELNPMALFASSVPAKVIETQSGKKGAKPPPLIPREVMQQPTEQVIREQIAETEPPHVINPRRELSQALARMSGKAAAKLLAELDNDTAVELLSGLHERDIARILEATEPLDAALWVLAIMDTTPPATLNNGVPALAIPAPGDLGDASPAEMLTEENDDTLGYPTDTPAEPPAADTPADDTSAVTEADVSEETTTSPSDPGTDSGESAVEESPVDEAAIARTVPAEPPPELNIA